MFGNVIINTHHWILRVVDNPTSLNLYFIDDNIIGIYMAITNINPQFENGYGIGKAVKVLTEKVVSSADGKKKKKSYSDQQYVSCTA